MPHHCTTSVRMSVIVNYLKSRMEILILNKVRGGPPTASNMKNCPRMQSMQSSKCVWE